MVCGGLLAFPISKNFLTWNSDWKASTILESILESIRHGTAARQLQKSISREQRNIRVCHFHTGIRSPRSFDTRHFQIDSKHLNKPHCLEGVIPDGPGPHDPGLQTDPDRTTTNIFGDGRFTADLSLAEQYYL